MVDSRQAIERATGYPYDRPRCSFTLERNGIAPIDVGRSRPPGDRLAVLAFGSNASPTQLARKFSRFEGSLGIPVFKARMRDLDVVYSAHITRYGSIPATLQASNGTETEVAILYLEEEQLTWLNRTEALGINYRLAKLRAVDIKLEGGAPVPEAYTYLSLHGCLSIGSRSVALTDVSAVRRRFDALDQTGIQRLVYRHLEPENDRDLDELILESIRCTRTRHSRTERLRATATRFAEQQHHETVAP